MNRLLMLIACGFLTACQSSIPIEIREPVPDAVTMEQARDPNQHAQGKPVRWGGKIIKVENKADESWIEIVAKELEDSGRPSDEDASQGRFLARAAGFIDPAIYKADREITVYGVLEPSVERKIGERPYTYPVIRVARYYLWEEYAPSRYYYDPWYPNYFYDRFYYPWGYRRFYRPYW